MRYLFGPVSHEFAEDNLAAPRAAGSCLAFSYGPDADLLVKPDDTWESFQSRFPAGWRPDFIALYLPYRTVPACLWSAPVPLVGLAGDWNLLWHCYRGQLQRCELVLCDTAGAERLARAGQPHVRACNLYGAPASFAAADWPAVERDIDVLFVGNFNATIQRERLPWLGRVARFEGRGVRDEGRERRCRVVLAGDVYGEEYRKLLARARIVLNRSVRGEWNLRVGEALAGGALLFQEADNREVPVLLADRRECVLYDEHNLEELLSYYLEHEDERAALADAGRRRLPEFTFECLWENAMTGIEAELPELRERVVRRPALEKAEELQARTWQALNTTVALDPHLADDLRAALEDEPRSATLANALGLMSAWPPGDKLGEKCHAAAGAFQRAWTADPRHVLAGLNLTEVLVEMGRKAEAVEQATRTLAMVERGTDWQSVLREGHYPSLFNEFRVEWERAGWENAGCPGSQAEAKRGILRWRLHLLLGCLTGDVVHLAEAVLARPDLPGSRAALGMALGQQRRRAEAVYHLRQALDKNPFDVETARALHRALTESGDRGAAAELAGEYRLIHEAAPGIVRAEDSFSAAASDGARQSESLPHERVRVVWEGGFGAVHSLALVNRELCGRLAERGHELCLLPTKTVGADSALMPVPSQLAGLYGKELSGRAEVHVAHQWPPSFQEPCAGRWVIMQPWEFGSLPRRWLEPLTTRVDEVWVPSGWVRDCFIKSGVAGERVHVIPLGVDAGVTPHARRRACGLEAEVLNTRKGFKFLFVGGTIYRKGIDLLLKAYHSVFCDRG